MGIRDRQVILRTEVDTVAIEGVFTCSVDGASVFFEANYVKPVSVGIHYPSKSLFFLSGACFNQLVIA